MTTKQKNIIKINHIDDPELLLEIDHWIGCMLEAFISGEFSKDEIQAVREAYEQYLSDDICQSEASQ